MGGVTTYKPCTQARNITAYGGTVNWAYPDRAQGSSDSKVATASVGSGSVSRSLWCDTYVDLMNQLPAQSEIVGIEVWAYLWSSAANRIQDSEVKILIHEAGDQKPVGANRARSDYWTGNYRTWGGPTDTWGLSRAQLDAFYYNTANDSGLHIKVTNAAASAIANVDSVSIRLYWAYKQPIVKSISASATDSSLSITANCTNRVTKTRWWYRHQSAATYNYHGEFTGVSTTISGLVGGSQYIVQVQAINEDRESTIFTSTALTTTGSAPQLTVSDIQSFQVSLAATATGTVNGYRWWQKKASESTWTDLGTTTAATRAVTGLSLSTAYNFRVRPFANEAAGKIGDEATANATTLGVPGATTGVAATALSETVIRVTCNTNLSATVYRFQRKRSAEQEYTEFALTTVPQADATGLEINTVYDLRVRGENSAGAGDWSAPATASTQYSLAGTVVDSLGAAVSGAVVLVFAWDDFRGASGNVQPLGKATSDAQGAFSVLTTGDGRKRAALILHSEYHGRLHVGAVGSAAWPIGSGAYSPIDRAGSIYTIEPQEAVPFASENFSLKTGAPGSLAAKWQRMSAVLSAQQLQLANNAVFANPIIYTLSGSQQSHTATMLNEGQQYWGRIRGRIASGEWSAWSNVATGVTSQQLDHRIAPALSLTQVVSLNELASEIFAMRFADVRSVYASWVSDLEVAFASVEAAFSDQRAGENVALRLPAKDGALAPQNDIVIVVTDTGRLGG